MGILTKLKSVLGMDGEAAVEADATVEREPTGVEAATAEPDAGTEPAEPDAEPESTTDAAPAEAEPESAAGDAATGPVEDIKGIGPAYADQLAGVGVETVGDLAAADPEELADETGLSAARVENWVEQARARTRT